MVALSRVVKATLALTVASVAVGCGALIGIEDGVADPGPGAPDATMENDSAMPIDAGAKDTSTTDTSTTPDAAPGPIGKPGGTPTTLPCGGMTCPIPAQSCCAYRSSTQAGLFTGVCAVTCAPPSGTTDRLATLRCSAPSNCPSTAPRCCYSTSSGSVTTTCKTSCNPSGEAVLCDPNGTNTCGSGKSCVHWMGQSMPPSWGYCQ